MKEHPILFSGPMVRAILEGRKTQTRRVVNPQPSEHLWSIWQLHPNQRPTPYGEAGSRLWVRETWAPHDAEAVWQQDTAMIYYRADDETKYESDLGWKPSIYMPRWASRITLEITNICVERVQDISEEDAKAEGVDTAFITAGLYWQGGTAYIDERNPVFDCSRAVTGARGAFGSLWDSINGKRPGYSWSDDPWCWVISFRRQEATESKELTA